MILEGKSIPDLKSYSASDFLLLSKENQTKTIQEYFNKGSSILHIMTLLNISERTAYRRLNNK